MGKRGQVTIFVIIAMVIVGSLIFLFLLNKSANLDVPVEENPQLFIQKCVREKTVEAIAIMLPQGGFISPENYKLFENRKIAYICENRAYYFPCVNQHPAYINELRTELSNYLKPQVEDCFNQLKVELQKRGSSVSMESSNLDVNLIPGTVDVVVNKKLSISSGDQTQRFDKFEISTISHIYDLASIAVEIANQEAIYCSFEYVGYMLIYPEFSIRKESRSDGTKIYIIKHKKSSEELSIAIRGCVIPPGI